MDTLLAIVLGIVALFWIVEAARFARGLSRMPWIKDCAPLGDAECPAVSVILAARDEAERLPQALESMLAQDYPGYEVVAVNDRSRDATPRILDEAAARNAHLKPVHIEELPAGWLGKPYALSCGVDKSTGEWLLFADGDVRFAPDLLRRAVAMALHNGWDHLALVGWLEMEGFWERTALTYFGLAFTMGVEPWKVSDAKSKRFAGSGMFQLVRRSAYEACGGHQRLAMEVVEDMKLGKIIKLAGFRSGVGIAEKYITLRWYAGLGNIVRGMTKNIFASLDFSLARVCVAEAAVLAISVLPFAAVFFTTGWTRMLALLAAGAAVSTEYVAGSWAEAVPLYALTHPLGALIFCWMMLRSTVITLWRGGIEWRGTFYRLEELRKGLV